MPPYNPIFDHLMFMHEMTHGLLKDAHPSYLPDRRRRASAQCIIYIDTYPCTPQMLVVASTDALSQVIMIALWRYILP